MSGIIIIVSVTVFVKLITDDMDTKKDWKNPGERIGDTQRRGLSAQHELLSGQHANLLEQSKALSSDQKKMFMQVNYQVKGIDTFLKVQEEREQNRYSSLSDSQKKIDSQIDGIKATFTELHRLQSENQVLHQRVYNLEKQLEKHSSRQHGYNDLER